MDLYSTFVLRNILVGCVYICACVYVCVVSVCMCVCGVFGQQWVNIFGTHPRVNGWDLGVPVSPNEGTEVKHSFALTSFSPRPLLPSTLWGAPARSGFQCVKKFNAVHTGYVTCFCLTLWSGPASGSVRWYLTPLPLKWGWITTKAAIGLVPNCTT